MLLLSRRLMKALVNPVIDGAVAQKYQATGSFEAKLPQQAGQGYFLLRRVGPPISKLPIS